MDLMNEKRALVEDELPGPKNGYLQKFRLYETRSAVLFMERLLPVYFLQMYRAKLIAVSMLSEQRYKKLLRTVDLTKDFFFSYSYRVMHSLQKNLCDNEAGQFPYETMFVWNEFLSRKIRNLLKNTLWTIALVYGFFKQVKLSISGRDFMLTVIARRSRYYAGTRYLKRGVNEKGRVANDVETEQIVFQEVHEGCPMQISSVVQNRGSIPLFWSQKTSRLNIKPDIILSRKDHKYEATRLHFENLAKRYGNPIIILNLIKTREKKPRESILRVEFANAIESINKDVSEENRLRFLHWDLNKYSRNKATNVLALLGKVAAYALHLTGIFYCQVTPTIRPDGFANWSNIMLNYNGADTPLDNQCDESENGDGLERVATGTNGDASGNYFKSSQFQKGVLRTNCIDCLDRTNVAQYAYGLVALGHQLHALGLKDVPNVDLDSPLADDFMRVYETMGDTLALQYGGSAAHNKIFSERRGQWKAATQSQELFRTIQRYYSNAYMDEVKQDAINVFLGYFQPQNGKSALWELNLDHHYSVGSPYYAEDSTRSVFRRSLSDGNILSECNSPMEEIINQHFTDRMQGSNIGLSESSPEISTCESDIYCSRYTPSMSRKQLFMDILQENCFESDHNCFTEHGDSYDCSNFLDVEWLSSSAHSCEEDCYDRSTLINSPVAALSLENVVNGLKIESKGSESECGSSTKDAGQHAGSELTYDMIQNHKALMEFSSKFVHWVNNGEILF